MPVFRAARSGPAGVSRVGGLRPRLPRIPQGHDAVHDRCIGLGLHVVEHEIADAFQLPAASRLGAGQARLEAGATYDLHRVGVELVA